WRARRQVAGGLILFHHQPTDSGADVVLIRSLRVVSLASGQKRQQSECCGCGIRFDVAGTAALAIVALGIESRQAPTAVPALMARQPIQRGGHGALCPLRSTIAGHQLRPAPLASAAKARTRTPYARELPLTAARSQAAWPFHRRARLERGIIK